jgi:hypothetical protein
MEKAKNVKSAYTPPTATKQQETEVKRVPGLNNRAPRFQTPACVAEAFYLVVGIQSAIAGPGLLLHEAVCASPFFETDTVPLGQMTETSASPEPQASVQLLFSQLSCLTTWKPVEPEGPAGPA